MFKKNKFENKNEFLGTDASNQSKKKYNKRQGFLTIIFD